MEKFKDLMYNIVFALTVIIIFIPCGIWALCLYHRCWHIYGNCHVENMASYLEWLIDKIHLWELENDKESIIRKNFYIGMHEGAMKKMKRS